MTITTKIEEAHLEKGIDLTKGSALTEIGLSRIFKKQDRELFQEEFRDRTVYRRLFTHLGGVDFGYYFIHIEH